MVLIVREMQNNATSLIYLPQSEWSRSGMKMTIKSNMGVVKGEL